VYRKEGYSIMPAESKEHLKFMALVQDFMQKKASDELLGGRKPVDPRAYKMIGQGRALTPREQLMLSQESGKWIPDIIDEPGENPLTDMASPAKQALLHGVGGALAGALLGKAIGAGMNTAESPIDSNQVAMVGSASTAALAAMLAYYKRRIENATLTDEVRRMPVGATRRDRDNTPAFMIDDPEQVANLARLNAALIGRVK